MLARFVINPYASSYSGPVRGSSLRSRALVPTFRMRRDATPSASAPVTATVPSASAHILPVEASVSASIPVVASAPQLFSLVDEDDEVPPMMGT